MKRLLCILLSALLLISAIAYAENLTATAGTTEETVEEKLYRMIPVLDSLARNMGIEGEVAYDANDALFFWTQLYLHGVNWSFDNPLVQQSDNQIVIPASVIQEYAEAAFYGMIGMPEIPEGVTEIRYDAATDSYVLEPSDMGETSITIERYATDAEGNLLVGVGLYSGNEEVAERLGGLLVQMTDTSAENAFVLQDATEEKAFPYAVKHVQVETEGDFVGLNVSACRIQYVEGAETLVPTATPVVTEAPEATKNPDNTYPKLSMGSRGDDVRALQRRLNDLGYDCGSVDGVFGAKTKLAVRYFQDAIGVKQDGVATNAVQQRLFASNAPEYVAYVLLKNGSDGVRVERLQNRLRELGYLAEPTDGEFGDRTEEAVKLFQKKVGLKQDGLAGVNTLKALYKTSAPKCDTYITLKKGDTGYRVKEMQNQLRQLGFLDKKASGTYDNDTVKAVAAFQKAVGVEGNGKTADKKLIKAMFDYVEPTPTPEVTPTPTPEVTPTPEPGETETPKPEETPTPEPGETETAKPEVTPTPEPEETETAKPEETPTPEPEETETAKPEVTPTPEPEETETAKPEVTPTPEPEETETAKPEVTPTPKPEATKEPDPTEETPESVLSEEQLSSFVKAVNSALGTSHDTTAAVKWLQNSVGCKVTGVYDQQTKDAVSAYQSGKGLEATGIADADTIAALKG